MTTEQSTKQWAAEHFGIKESEVVWYNSGTCYDRIGVTTKAAANKVSKKVKGQTANGGMLDGMPLGGYTKYKSDKGKPYYDVYC